jgi:hypothetical protein
MLNGETCYISGKYAEAHTDLNTDGGENHEGHFHSSLAAIGAGIVSTLLGGWDKSLEILLIFIIMGLHYRRCRSIQDQDAQVFRWFRGLDEEGRDLF